MRALRACSVPLFGISLAGCGEVIESFDRLEFEEEVDRIVFDLESGDVEVALVEGDAIRVERRVRYVTGEPLVAAEVVDGALELRARCPDGQWVCAVDHRVAIPVPLSVAGWTGSGRIAVTGAEGRIEVETGAGRVELCSLDGEIYAETGSGGIEMHDLRGRIDAYTGSGSVWGEGLALEVANVETSSGGVEVSWREKPHRIDLESGSGGIRLVVPSGSYQVDAVSGSGLVTVGGIHVSESCDDQIRASTGSGSIDIIGW